MTWHVRGKLKGLMCFHVDDIMISGPKSNEFDQCGCRIRLATDKSVTVDQESYARKIDLITMSAHRPKHMTKTLSDEEHTTMMAKRGELNWLATQPMIQSLAPLSLIDTSKTATGQSLKYLKRLVRQAHCEASDKLHYPVTFDPVFVSFADAAWANRKDFGSQCGYPCIGTERDHCWTEVPLLVVQSLGTLADVPELHAHPVQLKHRPPRKHKKRLIHSTCGWNCARRL